MLGFARHGPGFRRDSITSRQETETVLGFARHGPGFRSVKETLSRAGGDGDCVGFARHDQDSGLLKRQYHEQEETEIVLALLDTTRIQVC